MTKKYKLLSYAANEALASIERGPNAAGEPPEAGWFPARTVKMLERIGYITRPMGDERLQVTAEGVAYRAWAKAQPR